MKKSSVTLEITSESIYMHSISVLSFFSEDEFKVKLSYEKTRISKGIREENEWIYSVKTDNNIYCIEVSVIGLFQERNVIDNIRENVLGNHYGMRFYPFLSSYIRGKIECDRRILNASLKLPDAYRLLFFKSSIEQNKKPSTMRQSYGNKESSFLFTWNGLAKQRKDNHNFNLHPKIFVRLGGKSLFKLVKFPIYYWIIAWFSISMLAFMENIYVVIGAVATTWLFMLERWDKSSLPQQNTLLTWLYLIYGFLIGIWGFVWAKGNNSVKNLFNNLDLLLYAFKNKTLSYQRILDTVNTVDIEVVIIFFLLTLIILTIIITFKAINFFEIHGRLPKYIAYTFAHSIIKGDTKRKKIQTTDKI